MKQRCAIYARYSSDLQRESSIEDQIRRCREYALRQGWQVVEELVSADRAVSAASVAGRDGLQQLVRAARAVFWSPFSSLAIYSDGATPPMMRFVRYERGVLLMMES